MYWVDPENYGTFPVIGAPTNYTASFGDTKVTSPFDYLGRYELRTRGDAEIPSEDLRGVHNGAVVAIQGITDGTSNTSSPGRTPPT